ncbi:hypothetical protein OPQ81_007487 [Rhizoctonia solani]|nr:hypothetical protein OPQ81_007487 [Rhizoctonia solani]
MSSTNSLSCLAIQRWEEAGASLLTTFKNYADLCINIETKSLKEGTKPQDLASQIETMLETVHAAISDQLPKLTATLSRTLNKFASRALYLPEEVLLEIFTNVIFGRYNPNGSEPLPMRDGVRHIYKRLYTLCLVCSTWRGIVMAREQGGAHCIWQPQLYPMIQVLESRRSFLNTDPGSAPSTSAKTWIV